MTTQQPGTGPPGPGQLAAAVRQVLPSARADLEDLVRIPSVSADPAAGGSIPFVTAYAGLVPDAEILITGVEDPGRARDVVKRLTCMAFR